MRFGAIGMKRPEAFPKLFNVYRKETSTSARGRERDESPVQIGQQRCILSVAKPEEQQRFAQMGVTVTHTIFCTGVPDIKENDMLALLRGEMETRFFRIQAKQDHGEMDIYTTFYCEERGDINAITNQSDGTATDHQESG